MDTTIQWRVVRIVPPALALAILAACGGGGGGGGEPAAEAQGTQAPPAVAQTIPEPPPVSQPTDEPDATKVPGLPVLRTSYENLKAVGLTPQNLPAGAQGAAAYAFADFSRGGRLDMFIATAIPPHASNPKPSSKFAFWLKQEDGSFVENTTMISSMNADCAIPRKAIVADFNRDGRPDVFLTCQGYGAVANLQAAPVDRSQLLLSVADGTYRLLAPTTGTGRIQGATAGDLNGDDRPDLVIADPGDPDFVYALLNQEDGTFVREALGRFLLFRKTTGQYTAIELVDVNQDGQLDLLAGGSEVDGQSPTTLLINPQHLVGAERFIRFATSPAAPIVTDFTVSGGGDKRLIYISRQSVAGATDENGRRYAQERGLQMFAIAFPLSTIGVSFGPGWAVAPLIPSGGQLMSLDASETEFKLLLP